MFQIDQKEGNQLHLTLFYKELQQQLMKNAQSLKNSKIDSPLQIYMLTKLPDSFITSIVNFQKLHIYIQNFNKQILSNQQYMKQLLIVYRRKFTNTKDQDFKQNSLDIAYQDTNFFQEYVKGGCSLNISNQFIKFQLAAGNIGFNLFPQFPEYILSFSELEFQVFFQCINHFVCCQTKYLYPQHVQYQLIDSIEKTLQKFLQQFNGKQTDHEVKQIKQLITQILFFYYEQLQKGKRNQFGQTVLNKLMIKQSFCCTFFAIMKKYGILGINFKKWINIIIKLQQTKLAINLIQYALFYFTNLVDQLHVLQIIQQNSQWSQIWIKQLIHHKFQMIESMFLNGQQHYFIIINKLFMHYKFQNQDDFYGILLGIDYFYTAKKLYDNQHQHAKKSLIQLFQCFVGIQRLNQLFQGDG